MMSFARSILRVMRPHQWIKNIVCFAGLIFSGRLLLAEAQEAAALAFAAFCFAASSVYVLNDLIDRERDRMNPRTAKRPIASGKLSAKAAVVLYLVLVAASVGIALLLSPATIAVISIYIGVNVLYSVKLKNTVIVDVMCIAFGFVLRVLGGVYAVGVLPSSWIVLCMFAFALFLGFSKRHGELAMLGDKAPLARPVLRKYTLPFANAMLILTATLSIITYAMYTTSANHSPNLVVTTLPVIYCILRYLYKVVVERFGESPDRLLYTDRMLWIGTLIWVVMVGIVLYLPNLGVLFI